ncbi:MAG: lipoyl(octanoyl) transferase LipB [Chloroflexia bacterium]
MQVQVQSYNTKSAGRESRPLVMRDLGTIDYADCWDLQKSISQSVGAGESEETLLLLEHPHTYTCGRRGGRDHILVSEAELKRAGVTVLDVDRGGDVTYHGPGQLVAYPIINLGIGGRAIDYPGYVRTLERVLVGLLADFGISSYAVEGYSGVWVRVEGTEAKIAAIGVKVDGRGITTHGIALNVSTDLSYFTRIVPCGIADKPVTSMDRILAGTPDMAAVKASFTQHFCRVFGFDNSSL